jgi:hypothetical protein
MAMSKEEKAVRDSLAQVEKDAAVSDAAVARMNQPAPAPVSTYEEARLKLSEIKDPKIRAAFEKSFAGVDASTERLKTQATGLGLQLDPNTGFFVPAKQQEQKQTLTAEQYAAQQAAAAEAEEKRRKGQSAYDSLSVVLGPELSTLLADVKNLIISGANEDQLVLALRQTPAYALRFAANAERVKKGLKPLPEATYLLLEDQYQNVMRNYGLPASYYTKGTAGRQEGFEKLIAGDVSDVELEERIVNAQKRVIDADPNIKEALKQFYPDIKDGEILAYVLDPDKGLADIKKKITAAEIGGAAMGQGLKTGMARAEELARYGVTAETARAGFGAIGGGLERGSQLANIYQQQPYTQTLAEEEVFNLPGQTDAQRKRKKIIGLEQAEFAGQTGITSGALGRERAGSF